MVCRFPCRPAAAAMIVAVGSAFLIPLSARAADPTPSPGTSLVLEGWRHRVWAVYPLEKFKADEALPLEPRGKGVRITAAGGEREPLILVLRTDMPLRDVQVRATDLAGPQGVKLAAKQVESRRIGYIYVDEPSGTRIANPMPYPTGTGQYPDPLLTTPGVSRPGRNLQFLVTVDVPRAAKAGLYHGSLEIAFRREGWMPPGKIESPLRVPLEVLVRHFVLPEVTPLVNTAFYRPGLPRGIDRDEAWLKRLYREFVANRQVPEPLLPSPAIRVEKDGTLSVDTTRWEAMAQYVLEELHAHHLFLPVWSIGDRDALQGIYFIWHFPAATKQRWYGALIAGEDRRLTAEFQRLFGAYLRQMTAVLKRRGWLDRVYLATMDEPYTYHTSDRKQDIPANNYELIRNYVELVRREGKGLKTFVTGDPVPELEGLVDHWCLRNLTHAGAARKRAETHGEVFTYCDNYRTFIDYPAVSARSLGWLAWKMGARGWLTYETMGNLATNWEGPVTVYPQFNAATVWGLGQMFYPDPVGNDLVASLRWELMREGCDDYEYLWLLRQAIDGLDPARQKSSEAIAARRLLETAAGEVVGGSGDAETESAAARPNAASNSVPHRLREQAAELIERLQGTGSRE